MLTLEAWPEAPPRIIMLENVPRIMSRGRVWLDAVASMLDAYGYAWRETTHDCGELGGLAQHRRRFLGVARLARCEDAKRRVDELLYEPPTQRVRGIGEVIGALPVPGPWASDAGGPMHSLSRLSAMNWLRLALIPPGQDWRALPERVHLVEGCIDPRSQCQRREGSLGVTGWQGCTHAVIGAASIQNTSLQVADPRLSHSSRSGNLSCEDWHKPGGTIIGASSAYHGQTLADPRLGCTPRAGAYGVSDWSQPSCTVVGAACHDNSGVSVADERGYPQPTHMLQEHEGEVYLIGPRLDLNAKTPTTLVIQALDGTWHRPMTTLELAALQSLPLELEGQPLVLDGRSHQRWRQRIGNAIPSATAHAIAQTITRTLDTADQGGLLLSAYARWVAPCEATL
jgi:site-specific DNA-cytosine methylase